MVSRRVKWSIAFAAGLAAFALLEVGVRVALDPPVYIGSLPFDPELGYTMPRSIELVNFDEQGRFLYHLNAQGFRGPELPPEGVAKPPGVERILFVGDSFQNAWAVREEELMSTVCARLLREQGHQAEAFVFSCDDYGTAQELMLLDRYGERVRPDAVVLSFHPANDVANNSVALAGTVETSAGDYVRPYLVPDGEGGFECTWAQPARAFLRGHLRSFALLDRALIARARNGGLEWYAPWPLTFSWLHDRLKAGQTPAEWHEIFREHPADHPWERAWELTGELIRAVASRARALGARPLVLVVPGSQQVEINAQTYRQIAEIRLHGGGEMLATFDLNLPEARVAALCADAAIDARFLVEPLREAVRATGRSHYVSDGHLNGKAHAIAAAIVADWFLAGDAFPSARSEAPRTGPVSLLPLATEAPRWLDLTSGEPNELLAEGWHTYLPRGEGSTPAWAASERAIVLLPLRPGDRVEVEGRLLADAPVPTTLTFQVSGVAGVERVLEDHEPFRIELVLPRRPLRDGLSTVIIAFSRTLDGSSGDLRKFGAIITGVGVR